MIGSPDLLAFTGTEEGIGDGDWEQEALALPEELSVPLLPPSQPWTTSAQFNRDFILVAEFSEQVGPKPVLTIPDDPRVIGSFDLNHFSVRIMSVDYQASGPTHALPSSPGPRLNFSEDSKVILGDSADDAFAYVHHMTLYDLEARGMVRPFCMAYVCSDQAKLMENFVELSTCFSQASDSLKTGNRQAFSMELQRKLQELEYRWLSLLQEREHPSMENTFKEVGEKANELEAVECSISNHRDLLRQVTSYPNRKLKQPDFLPYDPAGFLTDQIVRPSPEPCSILFTPTSSKSERHLKPLQELCNPYFLSLMKEQLANTERRLRGDRSVLCTARLTHSLSRRLTLINFLFEQWSPEDVDEEESESADAELQSEKLIKSSSEVVPSEPVGLESCCSCVEEIQIKLETGEARTWTPDSNVAVEMTGSVSSSDSIEVLGTEKSYRTQNVTGFNSRETPIGMTDTSLWRVPVDVGVRRGRAYARRANSEDSIEVLSTTESINPDDLTAITEEEAENQPLSNGFKNVDEMLTDAKSDYIFKENMWNETTLVSEGGNRQPAQEDDGYHDRNMSSTQIPVNGEVLNNEHIDECPKSHQVQEEQSEKMSKLLQEAAPQWSEVHQTMQQGPDLHVNFAPPTDLAEVDSWSSPCTPLRSIDEASDCNSFTGSSQPPSPTRNILCNTSPDKRRRKAALRALRFLKQNSFSQHAVFCLLSGRPLIVIGGNESLVRKLVDGLSLFLPAADMNTVTLYLTSPLQLTDLLTWRLIGIHRSPANYSTSVLHSLTRYSRYVAVLDLDHKTLNCPSYSGSLISRLADPQMGISRGITYLLHLESGLTALANQALLYTFNQRKTAGGKDCSEDDFLLRQGFCSTKNDLRVMHFLSDLIKKHHAGCGPPILRFYYCPMHLLKNTYEHKNG